MTDIRILEYSEKSFVIVGDTKQYKEQIKELGGKFNSNLTKDGNKLVGWIFSNKKRSEVEKFITSINGNNNVTVSTVSTSTPEDSKSVQNTEQTEFNEKLETVKNLLRTMNVDDRTKFLSMTIESVIKM